MVWSVLLVRWQAFDSLRQLSHAHGDVEPVEDRFAERAEVALRFAYPPSMPTACSGLRFGSPKSLSWNGRDALMSLAIQAGTHGSDVPLPRGDTRGALQCQHGCQNAGGHPVR